jgi:hypothetical protein
MLGEWGTLRAIYRCHGSGERTGGLEATRPPVAGLAGARELGGQGHLHTCQDLCRGHGQLCGPRNKAVHAYRGR